MDDYDYPQMIPTLYILYYVVPQAWVQEAGDYCLMMHNAIRASFPTARRIMNLAP
jgi:hypothetical protein